MKVILFSFFILFFPACESLNDKLKPRASIGAIKRAFNKIAHQHELSIIEDKDFDLVAKLTDLYKSVKRQIYITEYNWNVLNDDYIFFGRGPHWVVNRMDMLNNHRESLENITQELSMLIEKILAVKKVVKQIEERKKKEKDVIEGFTI